MIFRFGSVLFRDGGAADPSNGSNFASCNRDKNHAIAHTLIIRLMKTGVKAEKHRLASHYIYGVSFFRVTSCSTEHSKVSEELLFGFRVTRRSHEITLPVWDKGTLQSRVPRKMPAAHEKTIALR